MRPIDDWRWPRDLCGGRDIATRIRGRGRDVSSKHPVFFETVAGGSSKDLGSERSFNASTFRGSGAHILEGLPEGRDKLATKDLTQYRFGQE
jgi:hypothetical protein